MRLGQSYFPFLDDHRFLMWHGGDDDGGGGGGGQTGGIGFSDTSAEDAESQAAGKDSSSAGAPGGGGSDLDNYDFDTSQFDTNFDTDASPGGVSLGDLSGSTGVTDSLGVSGFGGGAGSSGFDFSTDQFSVDPTFSFDPSKSTTDGFGSFESWGISAYYDHYTGVLNKQAPAQAAFNSVMSAVVNPAIDSIVDDPLKSALIAASFFTNPALAVALRLSANPAQATLDQRGNLVDFTQNFVSMNLNNLDQVASSIGTVTGLSPTQVEALGMMASIAQPAVNAQLGRSTKDVEAAERAAFSKVTSTFTTQLGRRMASGLIDPSDPMSVNAAKAIGLGAAIGYATDQIDSFTHAQVGQMGPAADFSQSVGVGEDRTSNYYPFGNPAAPRGAVISAPRAGVSGLQDFVTNLVAESQSSRRRPFVGMQEEEDEQAGFGFASPFANFAMESTEQTVGPKKSRADAFDQQFQEVNPFGFKTGKRLDSTKDPRASFQRSSIRTEGFEVDEDRSLLAPTRRTR